MKIKVGNKGNIKVLLAFKDEKIANIDSKLKNYIEEKKLFNGKKGEIFTDIGPNANNIAIIGLGEKEKLDGQVLRIAAFNLAKKLASLKVESANIEIREIENFTQNEIIHLLSEGLLQSEYVFDEYKTDKEEIFEVEYNFNIDSQIEEAEENIKLAKDIIEGVFIARDLVNIPSIDMYPETLANNAKSILEKVGVEVEVLGKKEIEDLNMKAFLAVAEGSDKEPKFIIMKYLPNKDQKPLTFVGKGLTYDSGGYALKSPNGMVTMKSDMGGAASVIGAMYSIAKTKLNQNVVAVIAACENMISGRAYKNGDIVSSMKGTTIEIINTDAEGRVTLADSIYYAATKIDSAAVIDLATLTGACVVGLGDFTTGLVTNNQELCDNLVCASKVAGEYLWQLPVQEELRDMLKGKNADLTNSTGRMGGAITAGLFLENFVEGKPWVHMDIAGPAFAESAYNYIPAGGTGIPVKTLYLLAKNFNK